MSGEDQERFEDYLELEHYIEELQAGHIAHPPSELTPGQTSIYRMAALFRSAPPDAGEPRPEFAAELQARLEQELQQAASTRKLPTVSGNAPAADQPQPRSMQPRKPGVSRRALLAGGAVAAASLAAGTGLGITVERSASAQQAATSGPPTYTSAALIAADVPKIWYHVTNMAQLGNGALRFTTEAVVGYVIRNDGEDGTGDTSQVIAMSAACTHMGCIVQWQDSDRKYHCPCHGGLFSEYGKVDKYAAPIRYSSNLPRLNTRIDKNGDVYVEVPKVEVAQRQV
jgi:Rieske Fe-S protein